MEREIATGNSVLVVGAGIGGLTFAIEAYRKGHDVRIIERSPEGQYSGQYTAIVPRLVSNSGVVGEIIMITTPALHTPKKWPGFMQRVREAANSPVFKLRKFDGTPIRIHAPGDAGNPSELGIPVAFNTRVVEFFETAVAGGVTLENGSKLTTDVVVAADGIGSRSRTLENPIIAKEFAGHQDRGIMYIGPGAHMPISKSGDDICWLLTCKDENSTAIESWSKTTSTEKALKAVEGWDPVVTELVKATPNNQVLDWKLMWRDPQPQWASKGGRVVQLGDAAHPFLPTSFSGGIMAMEDACSLAACLSIGGKQDVPLATKVHNKLRFERVSCAQKMGFKNREIFHNTDWSDAAANTKLMGKMVGDWLTYHDPEVYANENYHKCAEHLTQGTPFENTNMPPGYTYKPWTVKELLGASERGEVLEDEGDWS
ncbi:hypothetical protein E8E11_009306 [Didymella keratinophila]|nr:hypothetical protein E8E11_009306 [Didymella keratinophila]